jgi:hypothetical protein
MALAPEGIGVSCLYPAPRAPLWFRSPEDDQVRRKAEAGSSCACSGRRCGRHGSDRGGTTVVDAIRENASNILTHAEFLDEVRERHR